MATKHSGGGAMKVGQSKMGTVGNIQVLRWVASLMVLFGHLNHEVGEQSGMRTGFHPFQPIWWAGGVDIFFVISGFIMYYITVNQFGQKGASIEFLKRRLVRLAPPYWFFTTLALAVMILLPRQMTLHDFGMWQVIASYLFIPALNPTGKAFPVLILGWTLNFEMLFYLIFAVGLLFARAVGLAVITGILLLITLASALQPLPQPFGFWCNSIVLTFLFGITIAIARTNGFMLKRGVGITLALVGTGGLLAVQAAGIPGTNWTWRFLWAGLPSSLIVGGLALIPEAKTPSRIKRWLVFGGDASFALYLSHPFVLSAVAAVSRRFGLQDPRVYLAIAFAACVVGAGLIYRWFEKPIHTVVNHNLRRAR